MASAMDLFSAQQNRGGCRVPGCRSPSRGRYGGMCAKHSDRQRRHGHPLARRLTKAEIDPYLALVRARREKNQQSPVWDSLRERWWIVADRCRGELAQYHLGNPMNRYDVRLFHELTKLADGVEADLVIDTVLALFMLRMFEPLSRFASDDAFRFALVNHVRNLTDMNAGTYWNDEEQRVRRVYRTLSPAVTRRMAHVLTVTFAKAAAAVVDAEQRNREEEARREAAFDAALRELR